MFHGFSLFSAGFFDAFQGVRLLGALLDRVPGARKRCGLDLELEILQF